MTTEEVGGSKITLTEDGEYVFIDEPKVLIATVAGGGVT